MWRLPATRVPARRSKVKVPGFRPVRPPPSRERNGRADSSSTRRWTSWWPEISGQAISKGHRGRRTTRLEPRGDRAGHHQAPFPDRSWTRRLRFLARAWEPPAVTDEPDAEALEEARRKEAVGRPVERAAEMATNVTMTFKGRGRRDHRGQEDAAFVLDPGRLRRIWRALTGSPRRDRSLSSLSRHYFNEEFGWQGLHVQHLSQGSRQVLPELDDEFAKGVDDGYDSLDALKDHLRQQLQDELDHEDEHKYEDAVMTELASAGSVELPPIMIERAIDNHLQEIQDTIGRRIGRAISLESTWTS